MDETTALGTFAINMRKVFYETLRATDERTARTAITYADGWRSTVVSVEQRPRSIAPPGFGTMNVEARLRAHAVAPGFPLRDNCVNLRTNGKALRPWMDKVYRKWYIYRGGKYD
jgi:hypothetical protein